MRALFCFQVGGMKFSTIVCCGLIAAGSAGPALAAPFERGMGFRPMVQEQRPRPAPQRGADRVMPQRDMRGADRNDRGRMSPEERRQLRQDVQDAGKDIYRRDRQPPPDRRRSERR